MATDPTKAQDEWYRRGLRFKCSQCGNCCTGPPGTVWFAPDEGRVMAEWLGLDEMTFYRRHAHQVDGRWSLRERESPAGYDCIFLDRASAPDKAVCSLYEARPVQCRTWPFWPENLVTKQAWTAARRRTPCPGMGKGPLTPIEKIRVQRDATP